MMNRDIMKIKLRFLKIFTLLLVFNLSISAQPKVSGVETVVITVSDMNIALPFYSNVLHFEIISDNTTNSNQYSALVKVDNVKVRIVKLKLGNEKIELIDFISPDGKLYPEDSNSNDLWFQHIAIITNDMDSAYTWLKLNNVQNISVEPQRLPDWNKNAGGIKAFYFQDPDGHPLEILEFPPEKGNPKWHRISNSLFLGIDHTAIAVSNTAESLKFYRDVLGMQFGGESENYGIEQEKLNNIEDAHLRIMGLHSDFGPGIEFLNYLTPKSGKSYPDDVKANDLIHWQTKLTTDDINDLFYKLVNAGYETYTNVISGFDESSFSFSLGFIVKDPDGHRLLIIER